MTTASVPARGGARAFRMPRWLTSEHPFPWLAPVTAMLLVFGVYPLLYAVWLSLYKRNPVTRRNVFDPGWNWTKIFTDERVWGAIGHTFLYTAIAIVVELVLGLLIALLLDTDRRGYGLLRALMTLPLVVPPAVTGMMFLLMLDGSFGVLSQGLYALGLVSPQHPILATGSTALMGVLLADIWQWTPFMVLIMLAGLRALPKDPYEAAAIDGASATQAFFQLTLPMLVQDHRHRRADPRRRSLPHLRLHQGDDRRRPRHRDRDAHRLCRHDLLQERRLPLSPRPSRC